MDIFYALESGATIVTANSRLSRDLRARFHARQRDTGRRSWATPDVLPLTVFLERLWNDWVYSPKGSGAPVLLSPAQECAVWESIIGPAPDDRPLLDVPSTAQRVSNAWKIAHDYDLPIRSGEFQASDDCQAFLGWAREYEQTCLDSRWLGRATLPGFLLKRIAADEIARPSRLLYAGFDELTPRESVLLQALGAERMEPVNHRPRRRDLFAFPDARHEMEAAAAWARRALEGGAGSRIGVISQDLQSQRAAVQRVFQSTLDEQPFAPASPAFHISLGPALSRYPVVHAGLTILEAAASPRSLRLPFAGSLLRSPFFVGAQHEAAARAALDVRLRNREIFELSLDDLRHEASSCPIFQKHLNFLAGEIAGLPERQTANAWGATFAKLLQTAGWPGERGSDSAEYQAAASWRELLGEFSSLALALPRLPFQEALARLKRLASQTAFQPEDPCAPIQVMGVLEAGGLEFDRLWIMGLHDSAFPSPPQPNPFLPFELQRRYNIPRATPAAQLAASRRVLDRLMGSALELTLSYPQRQGEQELRPTPLIEGIWVDNPGVLAQPARAPMEEAADNRASPLSLAQQRGGSSLPKVMSACPFHAFADFRLGTAPIEDAEIGMSALTRGKSLHKALEVFWRQTQSHQALCAFTENELEARISESVDEALRGQENNFLYALERDRLAALLREWMEIEKQREPFTVLTSEEKRKIEIGGLTLETRVDRIDQLRDGRVLILDYKTGQVDKKAWTGERMSEPQLPLYCAGIGRGENPLPLAGVAFAQIRAGSLGFLGVTSDTTLPDLNVLGLETDSLEDEVDLWEGRLRALAERFREGHAEVDPRKGACNFCALPPLCRIHEARPQGTEGDDDAG